MVLVRTHAKPSRELLALAEPVEQRLDELVRHQEFAPLAQAAKKHFPEYLQFTQFFYVNLNGCDRDYCLANCNPCRRQEINRHYLENMDFEDSEQQIIRIKTTIPHNSRTERLTKQSTLYTRQEDDLVRVTLGNVRYGLLWQYRYDLDTDKRLKKRI